VKLSDQQQKAAKMQQPEIKTCESASALLGDLHPLLDQLGSAEGLITLSEAVGLLRVPEVRNRETLVNFLNAYKRELLLAIELPCIQKAYNHACGNQTRELVALDRAVGKLAVAPEFASASQRIGRCSFAACGRFDTNASRNVI